MVYTVVIELTFDRLLLEEVMCHGYNTLCRRDILYHFREVLQNNRSVNFLWFRTESVHKMTLKVPQWGLCVDQYHPGPWPVSGATICREAYAETKITHR